MFVPEIIRALKGYTKKQFFTDFLAGIMAGIVALPLSIAFAIASGAAPERGIFTAIIAGFCVSAFGGSRVQIAGPTGAFVMLVSGVLQKYGFDGLVISSIMAGLLLIMVGALKLGVLVKFIPYTIVTGFTAGIAVIIFATQIGDFFGLTTPKLPPDFPSKMKMYAAYFGTLDIPTTVMAVTCLACIFLWPKISKKIPGFLVVIVLASLITAVFKIPVQTIATRFGQLPTTLPPPHLPAVTVELIRELFPHAVSMAVLCAIVSLFSAVVADGMTGSKHNANMELIGEGISNIIAPIFGGIPATGAIARTAAGIKIGGRTPVMGLVHVLTLILIMRFLGKLAGYIPMPAIAAVLFSISWNMIGFPVIKSLLKGQKSDSFVLILTFLTTLFIGLTVAIEMGLLLSAFFFIKKMVELSEVRDCKNFMLNGLFDDVRHPDDPPIQYKIPEGVLVYEIDGPLFFGTVRKFEQAVEQAGLDQKVLIIRMRNTSYLDAGGIHVLQQVHNVCSHKKVTIILSGVHTQPLMLLKKTGMFEVLGEDNICASFEGALNRAEQVLKESARQH